MTTDHGTNWTGREKRYTDHTIGGGFFTVETGEHIHVSTLSRDEAIDVASRVYHETHSAPDIFEWTEPAT